MKIIFGNYFIQEISGFSFFKTRNTITLKESIKLQEETSSGIKEQSTNYYIKIYNDFFNKNLLHFGEYNTNNFILHASIKLNNAKKK